MWETMQKLGVVDLLKHTNVIIPGHVAVVTAKLKEVSGWNVIVGPRESSGIVAFAKTFK